MKERIEYLDGWRGVAIGMVLIAHFMPILWWDSGRFGVDLFFVLSGFLMARILYEQRTPIGVFYRRRISRIIPALLLFFAVVVGAYGAGGDWVGWKQLAGLLTFTRTYMAPPIWDMTVPVNNTWSLNVEEHCYVILSLVAAITVLRARASVVLGVLAMLTLVAIVVHLRLSHSTDAPWLLNTECAATGLLASAAYRLWAKGRSVPGWVPWIAIGLAAACYLPVHWALSAMVSPFLLAFAVNHAGSLWGVKALEFAPLRWLGLISYSVYLWQQPLHRGRWGLTGLALSLLIGAASFYLFESPIRRWLNENWNPSISRTRQE
jgi:peptidoglycan/LPS O-acetylase OafA/YrhL